MRKLISTLALLPILGIASAAHAESFTVTFALTDVLAGTNTPSNNFTLTGNAGPTTVTLPSSNNPDPLTITVASTPTNGTGNANSITDIVTLTMLFNPAVVSGSSTLGGTPDGTYKVTGNGNTDLSTITWSPNSTTVTLADGAIIGVSIANFAPSSNSSFTGTDNVTFTYLGSVAATPEPSSLALLGTGVLGVAGMVRRRIRG